LRLAHLLAFCDICSVVNCSMKNCGSGCVMVVVNICMSAQNFWYVSGFAKSLPKNTEATTLLSSRSMPALVQASLMMAWHFWRGPLTEVW
jgi:hypothetical protein